MTNSEKTTGMKIRALRHKQNKSQAEIAKLLEISIPAYSKIETGITDINLSRLIQIAELYQVSPAALLPVADNTEEIKANYQQLNDKISGLQTQVVSLQAKLIHAYEELDSRRNTLA